MRVIYENEFLLDFLNDFLGENEEGGSESNDKHSFTVEDQEDSEQQPSPQIHQSQMKQPEVIYQQYQPSNTTELREYMFFLICKKLKKEQNSTLGTGQVKNISNKLIQFLSENESMQKKLLNKYNNDILLFDSVFESGNLLQAEMVGPSEYQLYMQVDTNTKGHQQWFYFRIRNTKAQKKYTFRIMNFTKPSSCIPLNQPNQPAKKPELLQKIHYKSKLSSSQEWKFIDQTELEYIKTKVQRRRKDVLAAAADSDQEEGADEFLNEQREPELSRGLVANTSGQISNPNLLGKKSPKKKKAYYYYALQFSFEFEHSNDSVYFSFSEPVSYSSVVGDMMEKEKALDGTGKSAEGGVQQVVVIEDAQKSLFYKRQELCRSICGLPLYFITISRDSKTFKKKPIIAITSRVHAGETPGSFVSQGLFDFLTSDHSEAKFLRKFYTFIIIPILNPDGVVCGNYRNSVSGVDLNRQWICPEEDYHPEIFYTKALFKNLQEKEKRSIYIYCDMHGHSKKKNSFFYGCNTAANGGFLSWTIVRLLPRIFAKKTHLFSYKDCRFKVEPYKLGTGRVVAWKQFQVTHSFTLESSFYGYDYGEDQSKVFSASDYQDLGAKLCTSIYDMHFLWKQIRKELQLTNGWLKPRKLIELTGVPAAQLLNEELQKKRKDEQKKKAIELYEQFLKKFYNAGAQKRIMKPVQQQVQIQTFSFKPDQGQSQTFFNNQYSQIQIGHTIQQNPSQIGQQVMNQYTNAPNSHKQNPSQKSKIDAKLIPNQSFLEGSTPGVIRGKSSNQQIPMLPIHQQSISALDQDDRKEFQVSSLDQIDLEELFQRLQGIVKIQARIRGCLVRKRIVLPKLYLQDLHSANGINGQRHPQSNLHQFSNNYLNVNSEKDTLQDVEGFDQSEFKIEIDWRQYFQEQELEEAFQNVEIDKKDDPNEGYSSGSSSDPSQDNLDEREILEKIYEVDNMLEFEEERQQLKARFYDDYIMAEPIGQQGFLKHIEVTFSQKKDDRQHLLKNRRSTVRSPQKQPKPPVSTNHLAESIQTTDEKAKHSQHSKEMMKSQRKTPYYQQFYLTGMNIDSNILKKSNTQSPMPNEMDYPLIGHGIMDQERRMGNNLKLNSQMQQQRSLLSSGQNAQNLSYLHMKFLQQQQTGYNFRENINQVIKDCFITKKCGPTQQRISSQIQRSKYQNEGNRLHSFNTYKGLIQKSTQSKKNRKGGKSQKCSANGKQESMPESIQITEEPLFEQMINEEVYQNAQNNEQQSQSSLFMRYVKQKIVKKMKQDSIPSQVADKYLNIYKELIEREQKKLKGLPSSTILNQKDLSSRSELSNPKLKSNLNRSRNDDASRSPNKLNRKLERPEQSYHISPLYSNPQYEQYIQNQTAPPQNVFGETYFRQNNYNNSYVVQPPEQAKVKFPLINNFSSTLDYKKKSREIINELKQIKTQQSHLTQQAQPYNQAMLKSYEEQLRQSYQDYTQDDSYTHQNTHITGMISDEKSIQSSIDQDMIENIKNIYLEMKQNSKNQQYNNSFSGQKQNLPGFIKQKRIMNKNGGNEELLNLLPPASYDDAGREYQQQTVYNGNQQVHSKSVNYGYYQGMQKGKGSNAGTHL